ncbi:IclR family transcriptional regulator [soil metagenome]
MAATTLQSVRRALVVLEEIARSSPLSAKEIAVACDLELATTYHLVNTLIEAGYVDKDDRRLFPTGRLVELGAAVERRLRPDPALLAAMERLALETSETTYLSEWLRGDVVAVSSLEGTHPVRVGIVSAGERGFAHARASGKSLLAFGPPERLEVVVGRGALTPRTKRTIVDVATLKAEIVEAREKGYAVDLGEFIDDVCCISAPIVEETGDARYCLSVLVPTARFEASRERLIEAVTGAARGVRLAGV